MLIVNHVSGKALATDFVPSGVASTDRWLALFRSHVIITTSYCRQQRERRKPE